MFRPTLRRTAIPATALLVAFSLISVAPLSAGGKIKTSGTGTSVDVSWTEYDPDDLLGLPGNVHVGYLYASNDMYGTYFYGNVTDFDCDEGEFPYGGHGINEVIVDDAAHVVADAIDGAIDAVVDSDNGVIDAGAVIDTIQSDLADEIPAVIEDEFVEFPACDYIQDRFLEGQDTAVLTVDLKNQIATITGNLTVSAAGEDHGTGPVLGTPPVNITITGGEWNTSEWSYKSTGADYMYKSSQNGTSYYGGTVTGGIGAMGFADDADDVSYGGYSAYKYKTVERIR